MRRQIMMLCGNCLKGLLYKSEGRMGVRHSHFGQPESQLTARHLLLACIGMELSQIA